MINTGLTISEVLKKYRIKDGELFFNGRTVSSVELNLRLEEFKGVDVSIYSGKPIGYFCDWSNGIMCKKMYNHDEGGNIDGVFVSSEYEILFKKGNGFWKDYYGDKASIKEEGEVKNNFKFGEWKYYSKEGKIDSIKTYTLKDSVDVRFPHCIFNKIEPCY
ncbi:MAG: hypothetical protein ACK5IC_11015 [Moheibacter sp.]